MNISQDAQGGNNNDLSPPQQNLFSRGITQQETPRAHTHTHTRTHNCNPTYVETILSWDRLGQSKPKAHMVVSTNHKNPRHHSNGFIIRQQYP